MKQLERLTGFGEVLAYVLNDKLQHGQDVGSVLEEHRDVLAEHATYMAGHGVSHRYTKSVHVGVNIAGHTANGIVLAEGNNYSPYKGAPKDCGEIRGTRMADFIVSRELESGRLAMPELGVSPWIADVATIATIADDDANFEINNLFAPTVHPCATPCRPRLRRHPAYTDQTIFRTIAIDRETHEIRAEEEHTLPEFEELYASIAAPLISRELAVIGA